MHPIGDRGNRFVEVGWFFNIFALSNPFKPYLKISEARGF